MIERIRVHKHLNGTRFSAALTFGSGCLAAGFVSAAAGQTANARALSTPTPTPTIASLAFPKALIGSWRETLQNSQPVSATAQTCDIRANGAMHCRGSQPGASGTLRVRAIDSSHVQFSNSHGSYVCWYAIDSNGWHLGCSATRGGGSTYIRVPSSNSSIPTVSPATSSPTAQISLTAAVPSATPTGPCSTHEYPHGCHVNSAAYTDAPAHSDREADCLAARWSRSRALGWRPIHRVPRHLG